MTRSSNRLAATAAAVGGRNGAVALAPRVQAAAPTALGADLATRSTDEDDAGWVEEQYAWDSGVMVRRVAARRNVDVQFACARAPAARRLLRSRLTRARYARRLGRVWCNPWMRPAPWFPRNALKKLL